MIKKEKSEIISTVKKVMPAIVSIILSKHIADVEKDIAKLRRNGEMPDFHGPVRVPSERIDAHGMVQGGGGSGFIVAPSGIVLTNKHVITEPRVEYSVITNSDETYSAEVLARDPVDDVAI